MKKKAVEWYENEINALFDKYENKEISESEFLIMKHNLFYPAKEMEREQIKDAYKQGTCHHGDGYTATEYYEETFNTNG